MQILHVMQFKDLLNFVYFWLNKLGIQFTFEDLFYNG